GHYEEISEEALADEPQLRGLIDTELRYGLELVEEMQVLAGDGTGDNLNGLMTQASAFAAASGLPDTNRIERLRLAMLQVVLADYAADGMVLNPVDWAGIQLEKDGDGRFIIGNADAPSGPTLWNLPVVESNTQGVGTWLVGAMRMAATYYERQGVEILISSEHGENFTKGMYVVRANKRAALAVKRPGSLVAGNFTFA
ncbi:MAG: phage major capsid protein, partial [Pseudomonadales bacterium]|nr:phage major capsid protein [Pseudomonadales bacterium]